MTDEKDKYFPDGVEEATASSILGERKKVDNNMPNIFEMLAMMDEIGGISKENSVKIKEISKNKRLMNKIVSSDFDDLTPEEMEEVSGIFKILSTVQINENNISKEKMEKLAVKYHKNLKDRARGKKLDGKM